MILEELTPFETPSAHINQSLLQFNLIMSTIITNSHKINYSTNNLIEVNIKHRKYRFVLPVDVDNLLYHVDNFYFTLASFVKEIL